MTDTLLADLRGQFRASAPARLERVASLLDTLEGNRHETAALKELLKHFHAFAGMGGTYGFPRVSDLGDEGEGEILTLVRRGGSPDAAMLSRWRSLKDEIEREIATGSGVPWPGLTVVPRPAVFHVAIIGLESETASATADALEREDMTVQVCRSIADAISGTPPDAAIVDADQARELLEALQLRSEGASVGVIVVGDAGEFVEKLRTIRSGADAFVARPVDVTGLVRRVAALRERREHPARRIMAVEDDPTTAAVIRGILRAAGYEVAICADPSDFEDMLHAFEPDLLLMDVQLSEEVSGHDLVRYLRQSERFSTLPVIIVTSNSERRAILEGAIAGADMLMTKPVDWDLLLSQIAARLERATVVRELTDRDPLTGVLTRGAFEARVRRRVEQGDEAVFVVIDLDHFKSVNDSWGHDMGDRVLASMGTLLRRGVRQSDLVARYGGEEFALLLNGGTAHEAKRLCERLLGEFKAVDHTLGQGPPLHVTFSAGVAPLAESFETTFRRADAALYEAKRTGRGRVIV